MDSYTPLNIFLTVVKEQSFTRAAEKLFRTQPAISLAVQRLEQELGERLLDRTGRTLTLTDAGQLVFDCARRQENLQRELANQIAELRNLAIGRLVVGANESMSFYLLPHLSRYRRLYPKVRVVVQRSRSTELPDHLAAGDVDFGVVSYKPQDDRFEALPFCRDHLSFVVPPGHRLAKHRSVSIKELAMESFVAHNVASPYRDAVIRAFQQHKVTLNIDLEMPTLESIRLVVQRKEGVAFLPHMAVDQDLKNGLLKEVKVKEVKFERQIFLLRVAKRPLSHAGKAFLDMVEASRDEPGPAAEA